MNPDNYQLFVDLDGVLADFDAGVLQAAGKESAELEPRQMWPILARTRGFYAWLPSARCLKVKNLLL